ncbi:phage portal protein [Duganella sp. BJB476]|uniref:phage portal protein n=1 Tax=Duganella sp. BJB476 TaxID=1871176 RepID=UPI000E344907|nr:phage portal protein [Duganella sp. BJB476]RFP32426.1 phage portal protein [Duganella sp. BJB476]
MFLSAPSADSGDRSPWGGFWFNPVPFNGMNVTADSSLQLTAVYGCVRVLANAVMTLPFVLYEQMDNGGKKKITKHWLYKLFAKRPNDFQNPAEFRAMMQGHLTLRGNAFARIFGNGRGEVTDLIPIHPDRVTIELLGDTNWRYRIQNNDGTTTPVARQDMFHLKGISGDGILGYSPIQLARNALAGAIAAQNYGTRYFQNDASPTGGWIEHPGNFKDTEARRLWSESWQEQQGGKNKGKIAVLEYGLKFHPGVPIKNGDAQFIEYRKYSISDIARLFGVPPHMIGDLEKATFSNIEQQSIDFVIHSLTPWLVCWEEAIRYNFLDPDDDTLQVEFPTISLLRGDSAARGIYINTRIMNGSMTRNEARLMEGDNPLDGLDEPLRPLNMIADSAAEEEDTNVLDDDELPANANPNAPSDNPPEDSKSKKPASAGFSFPDDRLLALAGAAAERIARREVEIATKAYSSGGPDALARAYAAHAPFVSAALGVSMESVKAYCDEQIAIVCAVSSDELAEIARCKLERLALKG